MTGAFFWQNSVNLTLLHSVLQGQTCLLLQVSLDFLLFIPVPYDEKDIFFFFGTHTHTFKACIKGKTKATQVRSISRTQHRCDAAELGVRQAASLGSDRHPPDSVPPPSRIHPLRTRVWLSKHRLSPYGCCSVAKSCLTLQVSPRWSLL